MSAVAGLAVVDESGVAGPVEGTPVIVCFPSAGLASTIVGHYLIRSRNLPRCTTITSPDLPPAAVVIASLPNPPVRVHGDASVAVVVSEFPAPPQAIGPLAEGILEWVRHRKLGLVVVVEGILRRQNEGGEEVPEAVLGIPATAFSKAVLERASIPVLEEGVVGGIPAALLNSASISGSPLVVLFATANKADYPDHGAAARILENLNMLLPTLKLDPQPLYDQARIIEHTLRDSMKLHQAGEPPKQKAPVEPSMFG